MARLSAAQKRLRDQLDRLEPALRREVERALSRLRRHVTEADLETAILSQDLGRLRLITSRLGQDLERAVDLLARAVLTSQKATLSELTRQSLSLVNPAAVESARQSAAKLVVAVTEDTRAAIRTVVSRAFADRLTARQAAQLIRPVIGLTEGQATAVVNLRAALTDAKPGSLVMAGKVRVRVPAKGLTTDQIRTVTNRYADRLLKRRAELIARTEIIRASIDGQIEAWRSARANGLIGHGAQKVWIVTPDDRLCPLCQKLDGQTASIEGLFTSEGRSVQGPPLHPACRCAVGLSAVSLARAA